MTNVEAMVRAQLSRYLRRKGEQELAQAKKCILWGAQPDVTTYHKTRGTALLDAAAWVNDPNFI